MNEAHMERYILKLICQVDAKIHKGFGGHYALVTQPPFRGRANKVSTGACKLGTLQMVLD